MKHNIAKIIIFSLPFIILMYLTFSKEISFLNSFILFISFLLVSYLQKNKTNTTLYNGSSSLFVNIMENLTDPLLLLDNDSKILMANKSATNLFGNKIVNQNISDYLYDSDANAAIENAIDSGISDTVEFAFGNPRPRNYLLRIHVVGVTEGENNHNKRTVFLTIYDITKIREAERMRVDFVANASHELRTPLASILGFIETLEGPALNDKEAHQKFLKIMGDEAKRMARLIDDLLSLSHIERDAHIPPHENVSLKNIIENVIEAMDIRLKNKNIRTQFQTQFTTGNITADRDQLTQVFQNIIDNAIKYGDPNSIINIEMKSHLIKKDNSNLIEIIITNAGPGIPQEHLDRLTERFYRVDTARSRSLGGTGLGLAIVKHIIQRHNGQISFQSEIGKNTSVTIVLPSKN